MMGFREECDSLEDKFNLVKHKLRERIKELTCLYNLSKLTDQLTQSTRQILSKTLDLIPPAWQYPKLTNVKLSYGDIVLFTENFKKTEWKLETNRKIDKKQLNIEVYYLQHKEFLSEEEDLIEEIAERLKSIIEKKKLQRKLKNLNNFHNSILDNIVSGVWVSDENDDIIYSNQRMAEIANIDRKKLIGKNIFGKFLQPSTKEFIKFYKQAKKDLKPISYENIHVITPGKRESYQSGWLIPIKRGKKFSKMICTVDDTTEKRKLIEQLKDRESRYSSIVNSNSIGVARVNMKGHAIETNEYLHDMLGLSSEEMKKVHFRDFTHPDDVDIDEKLYNELISGEREYYHIQKRYIDKNDQVIWGDLTVTLIRDNNNQPKYAISLVQDITEREKAKIALEKSQNQLKKFAEKLELKVEERTRELKRSLQKGEFYKNLIAHDMNNILQNIHSSVQLSFQMIDEKTKSDNLIEINNILKEQILRATRLIRNTRKLSKIDQESLELTKFNVCDEIQKCVNFLKRSFQSREIHFEINCEQENLFIKANDLIQDLFENMLLNSINHNDSQIVKIIINVSYNKRESGDHVKIELIDNGIGITEELKTELFRSDFKGVASQRGMGLGLSLVNMLIQIYNGKIKVENRIKEDYTKGTKFTLNFPKID